MSWFPVSSNPWPLTERIQEKGAEKDKMEGWRGNRSEVGEGTGKGERGEGEGGGKKGRSLISM